MTIHKSSVRLNINPDRGSGVIYLKKEFAEKLNFESNTDLRAIYDDEKGELTITEL